MKHLTVEQLLMIHSIIIDETGGIHGVRDLHPIESLGKSPRQVVFGKKLYRDIFSKAAVYAREIIQSHPFIDGNKRSGMTAAIIFLEQNGYRFDAERGEIEKIALEIARGRRNFLKIAGWLKKHCQ